MILGLDDHDTLALDQIALHARLPEDDDPVHQPLTVRLALRQGQVFLHQVTLRVTRLRVPRVILVSCLLIFGDRATQLP